MKPGQGGVEGGVRGEVLDIEVACSHRTGVGVGDVTSHQDDDNDDWGEGEANEVGGRAKAWKERTCGRNTQ